MFIHAPIFLGGGGEVTQAWGKFGIPGVGISPPSLSLPPSLSFVRSLSLSFCLSLRSGGNFALGLQQNRSFVPLWDAAFSGNQTGVRTGSLLGYRTGRRVSSEPQPSLGGLNSPFPQGRGSP